MVSFISVKRLFFLKNFREEKREMLGCECFYWNQVTDYYWPLPQPFSLPSPLPNWPQGNGFSTERINLGDLEVIKITQFESVWSCSSIHGKNKGATFYRPVGIPDGFHCLGYYSQPNDQALRGYVLVACETDRQKPEGGCVHESIPDSPALKKPVNFFLIWSTDSHQNGSGYFWLPNPPIGYKTMGIVVTADAKEPDVEEVRCVRADLTEQCEICDTIYSTDSKSSNLQFQVWKTTPCKRGMFAKGVAVGTFYCATYSDFEIPLDFACLKNCDNSLHAMPNIDQIHALINHYGPTVFFHPDEAYLPSSVQWFFKNGALLYQDGKETGERIDSQGSILPCGGGNDGGYWIDLPVDDDSKNFVKKGDMESAELYVHVKPALGGTFTDIAMWIFCPFNGPATVKVGILTILMAKIGQHVGDWEHYTLRISNFTGELWQVFFSEHSGGRWLDASELEFMEVNKPVVYSSKHGHASYPHPGTYIQGSSKLGIGARNDVARSKYLIDSSTKYNIIAAEYLGLGVVQEPCWLQYMREWGPTVIYESRSELDKILDLLPVFVRFSIESLVELFPTELCGEEGPTGPKEKNNWEGDEVCL